ncbi:MAG: acyl carrier protein [Bdellovibrionota bacterium]
MKPKLENFDRLIRKTLNLSSEFDLNSACYGNPANWDSIRHVELFIALRNEFKFSFSADEITRLNTYIMLKEEFIKRMSK